MSAPAFIVSKHVRHLAVWTQDRVQPEDAWYPNGHFRPLCGGSCTHRIKGMERLNIIWANPDYPYNEGNQKRADQAMAKPLCANCLATMDALNEVTR